MQQIAERIAVGFAEAERQRRANVPGASVVEIDGLLLAFANVPDPPVNSTLVVVEPANAGAALDRAEAEFRLRARPFGIDVAPGRHPSVDRAIRSAGLSRLFSWPAMAARVEDLPTRALPKDVRVGPVGDAQGAAAVGRVERALLEPSQHDSEVPERFYAAASYGVEGARTFVAWRGDEAVGIASAHVHEGAIGLLGVGVIPAARRQGIASAISMIAARTFDADLVWLHASEMGRALYAGLGFRTVADWEVWTRPGAR